MKRNQFFKKVEYIIPDISPRKSLDSFKFNEKFNDTLWTSPKSWQGREKIGAIVTENSILFQSAIKLGYRIVHLDDYLTMIHENKDVSRLIVEIDDNRENIFTDFK